MSASSHPAAKELSYWLGCPLWSLADWRGRLYRASCGSGRFLQEYASVFNAVEGNTTFYAVPSAKTVARWLGQVPEDFRFCFKMPRDITHERRLTQGGQSARQFVDRLRPLGARVGTLMVQLPGSFGPRSFPDLLAFLGQLPQDMDYAVELRHRAFFHDDTLASEADECLRELGVERVILDSRPLYGGDQQHPDVLAAEHPKPDLPVRPRALTRSPLVRLITHPDRATTMPWLEHWARQVVDWMLADLEPCLFVHCPNNLHSPDFARALHQRIVELVGAEGRRVAPMAPWPGESDDEQLTLL